MAATSYSADSTLYLYTSLTAGSSHIITATSRLETILKANKIPFRALDCATDEKARMLWGRRSKGRKLPGLVKYGTIVGDLEQIEEWNEYGELKEQIAATSDFGGLTSTSATTTAPAPPVSVTATSTPPRSGPPSRASSETRHVTISDPKNKDRETADGGTTQKHTDTPMSIAMRQLGAEAAAKAAAGQKKAAAAKSAAPVPTKEPSTTDQVPVPAATKLSVDAAADSPDVAAEVTAAKTPALLAAEGAKRTSVDKIAEASAATSSEDAPTIKSPTGEDGSSSSSTEAQLVDLRRASSITKVKSRLSEATPAAESETVLEDKPTAEPAEADASEAKADTTEPEPKAEDTAAVPASEVSAAADQAPPPPPRHRGSEEGVASAEEIKEIEQTLSSPEDVEKKAAKEAPATTEPAVTSTDETEQPATTDVDMQDTDAKDADKAGVSVGD